MNHNSALNDGNKASFSYRSYRLHVVVQPDFRKGREVLLRSHLTHGAERPLGSEPALNLSADISENGGCH